MKTTPASGRKPKVSAPKLPVEKAELSESQTQELLSKVAELWNGLRRKDLATRHETGKLLNKELGDPDERQEYGAEAVKKVCEEIGLDKTEVSRMRRFAKQFPKLDALYQQHPKVTNWSTVKNLLVKTPKPKASKAAESNATDTSGAAKAPPTADAPQEESTALASVAAAREPEAEANSTGNSGGEGPQAMVQVVLLTLARTTQNIQELASVSLGEDRNRILLAAAKVLGAANNLPEGANVAA